MDILAQTLRLAAIHTSEGRLTLTTELQAKLDQLVTLIQRHQAESDDERIGGGIYFWAAE